MPAWFAERHQKIEWFRGLTDSQVLSELPPLGSTKGSAKLCAEVWDQQVCVEANVWSLTIYMP